ncbi:MAG: hypothetical protein DI533_00580 [Cereibacter sphaeroides]|uniref:Uncharacterized protein n=1 Tax=Cereibacter sphaeroides TaxID=1063 RepID=A0A2W5SBK7_CERSP|nr:MAG: hypothetical protein DI533_00580 [Cereibacter sphaeroides]
MLQILPQTLPLNAVALCIAALIILAAFFAGMLFQVWRDRPKAYPDDNDPKKEYSSAVRERWPGGEE